MTVSNVSTPVEIGIPVASSRRRPAHRPVVIASIVGLVLAIAVLIASWLTLGSTDSVAPVGQDHTAQLQRFHADAYDDVELARLKALQNFHEDGGK